MGSLMRSVWVLQEQVWPLGGAVAPQFGSGHIPNESLSRFFRTHPGL